MERIKNVSAIQGEPLFIADKSHLAKEGDTKSIGAQGLQYVVNEMTDSNEIKTEIVEEPKDSLSIDHSPFAESLAPNRVDVSLHNANFNLLLTNEISDKVVVETAKANEFEVESLSVIEAYSVKNLASHEEYLQTSEDNREFKL